MNRNTLGKSDDCFERCFERNNEAMIPQHCWIFKPGVHQEAREISSRSPKIEGYFPHSTGRACTSEIVEACAERVRYAAGSPMGKTAFPRASLITSAIAR